MSYNIFLQQGVIFMLIQVIFFTSLLIVGLSPILATGFINPGQQFEQQISDQGVKPPIPVKLDMSVDPDTMDIYEQPEGFDIPKK